MATVVKTIAINGQTVASTTYDMDQIGARAIVVDLCRENFLTLTIEETRPDATVSGLLLLLSRTTQLDGAGDLFCIPVLGKRCRFSWTGNGANTQYNLTFLSEPQQWGNVHLLDGSAVVAASTTADLYAFTARGRLLKQMFCSANMSRDGELRLSYTYAGAIQAEVARVVQANVAGAGVTIGPMPVAQSHKLVLANTSAIGANTIAFGVMASLA